MKVVLPAGLTPATATFEASHSDNLSYGSVWETKIDDGRWRIAGGDLQPIPSSILDLQSSLPKLGPMERLALSWGNARQFTKLLLSLLSHIGVGKKAEG
jgi:hypothetical protein